MVGSVNFNVFFFVFYSKMDGVIIVIGDEKFGFCLNFDVICGKFKMGEFVSYSCWLVDLEFNLGFFFIYQVMNMELLVFFYDENNDGGYGGVIFGMGMFDVGNQVVFNKLIDNISFIDYIVVFGYLQYELIKGFIVKFNVSCNMYFSKFCFFIFIYEIGVVK